MPKGYRTYVVTFAVALTVAMSSAAFIYDEASRSEAFYKSQAEKSASAYRDTARLHAQRACARVPRAEILECAHEQYHAARQRERDEYDLQAQLIMSAWTRAMTLSALVAMIVGIIGVGLVYTTFAETRFTNRIAMKENARSTRRHVAASAEAAATMKIARQNARAAMQAAKATGKANALAEESMRRQLRPWLAYDSFARGHIEDGQIGDAIYTRGISFEFIVLNAGNVPAAEISIRQSVWTTLDLDEPIPDFTPYLVIEQPDVGSCAPGKTLRVDPQAIGGQMAAEIYSGLRRIVICAYIEYGAPGVLGRPYRLAITREFRPNGTKVDPDGVERPYFSNKAVGPNFLA